MTIANHGNIDKYIGPTSPGDRLLDCFAALVEAMDYLCTGPGGTLFERVACQYGKKSDWSDATGLGYQDSLNPCGDHAFVVYKSLKTDPAYYLLIQVSRGYTDGANQSGDHYIFGSPSGPGTPAVCFSGYENQVGRIGISAAASYTGGVPESPWAGTTNNNGTDTKGAQVWSAAGSLLVFPRENAALGPNATNKEFMGCLVAWTNAMANPGTARVHVVGSDAGHLWIGVDGNGNAAYAGPNANNPYSGQVFIGPVDEVRSGITPQCNLLMLANVGYGGDEATPGGLITNCHVYGAGVSSSANRVYRSGGCAHPVASNGVVEFNQQFPAVGGSPNQLLPADTADLREWTIILHDTRGGVPNGPSFLGHCTWLRVVYNELTEVPNASKSYTAFGRADEKNTWKTAVPWDGVTTVGGASRAGVTF